MGLEDVGDEELLQRSTSGDQVAFATLMRRHEDRIFALCFRMLHERADAFDATQETFISAFRKADRFRGDSAFSTWLYRIGINTCKDMLRKRSRTPVPQEEEALPLETDSHRFDEAVVDRMELIEALEKLPHLYREAVILHDLGGVPYEEIADVTGDPVGTIKSRISRGRRKLASSMEQATSVDTSKDQR